jgi:endonuclease/exonuclease/phosphatase family metal-dependent hydrolase
MRRSLLLAALTALLTVPVAEASVRFATFNASLNRANAGDLRAHLSDPSADTVFVRQAKNVAEVVQRVRPDVLLINEFDFDPVARDLFRDNFLAVSQNGAAPIDYPYSFIAPSNTGVPSGHDLDNNGSVGGPNDAFGFGFFEGQFGMVVYSRYPIDQLGVRTFQRFLWKDMPGALLPVDPATGQSWYSPAELAVFRLSSKSHWDVPVLIGGKRVHFLTAHPTPPVFDGPEDRNGTRNHDEIRLWADYVMPGRGGYIYDDAGRRGGLKPGEPFVIAGDYNSDPLDGDSIPGSAQLLLEHPLVNAKVTPESAGAVEASVLQGGANLTHRSDPRFDTADFNDAAPGNLRADYVLPSKSLRILDSGVFWPVLADPLSRLTGVFNFALWGPVGGFPTSDHRSVWVDVAVPSAG